MGVYLWTDSPVSNILVYLPLNGDANDSSGNGHNGTLNNNSGGYSWEYISGNSGKKCFRAYMGATGSTRQNGGSISGTYGSTALGTGERTVSIWIKFTGSDVRTIGCSPHWIGTSNGGTNGEWFGIYSSQLNSEFGVLRYNDDPRFTTPNFGNTWHHIVVTYSSSNLARMYIDGVKQTFSANGSATFNTLGTGYQLGALRIYETSVTTYIYMSEYIIDGSEWTQSTVTNYYNSTKGDYGIS